MQLNKHGGFSMVEMLVSLVAGLVVVAGAISLFTTVVVSGNTTLMLSRLNQDVQAISDMLSRDIQRAGYDSNAAAIVNAAPASSSDYTFSTVGDLWPAPPASSSCIRIKYRDSQPSVNEDVIRIYWYDAANKELKYQDSSSLSSATATGALATLCGSTTGWSTLISEKEVQIDNLSFALSPSSSASGMRAIKLNITASHAKKAALSMSLQRQVKLRNDGY